MSDEAIVIGLIYLGGNLWLEYQEPRLSSPLTVRARLGEEGIPYDLGEVRLSPVDREDWLWCFYPKDGVVLSARQLWHLAIFLGERNKILRDENDFDED